MLRWQIGDVRVSRIVEMEVPVPYHVDAPFLRGAAPEALRGIDWLHPHFATPDGLMILSVHALLVEAPGMRLIVDTCIGNDKPRGMTLGFPLQTAFLDHLASLNCPRETIDAVICTHLHVDHVGWNTMLVDGKFVPTFPNARYLIGREEIAHWRAHESDEEHRAVMADSVAPIFEAGLVDLVKMDQRISPEIRLMPSAGHTPGHVSVMIESRSEVAVITGDVLHHPCQMAHPDWHTIYDSSRRIAEATRRALLEDWADRPVLVIGTHFAAPTAGHVKRDGAAYRFEA